MERVSGESFFRGTIRLGGWSTIYSIEPLEEVRFRTFSRPQQEQNDFGYDFGQHSRWAIDFQKYRLRDSESEYKKFTIPVDGLSLGLRVLRMSSFSYISRQLLES